VENGKCPFQTKKEKLGQKHFLKKNCAQLICLEMKAGRIAAEESQRGKKRTLKGTGHLGDLTFKLNVRESRAFWRLPLSCRVTAASALGHLHSPREATS